MINTTKTLFDTNKKGTLIVSTYRAGTHFVHDYIRDIMGSESTVSCSEICNDNTISQLIELTNDNDTRYKVAILNNASPKCYLFNNHDLLKNWHVVRLTRQDKTHHFISHWFWKQNFNDSQRHSDLIFQHHGTDYQTYIDHMPDKIEFNIESLIVWLQEQLLIFHVDADVVVDYDELKYYESDNISWTPNRYDNINLEDLFLNHHEIKILLDGFKP